MLFINVILECLRKLHNWKFVICTLQQILLGDQNKEREMGAPRNTHGSDKNELNVTQKTLEKEVAWETYVDVG